MPQIILMVICNKCYNEHHDQCMGKAGMFECKCQCLNTDTK